MAQNNFSKTIKVYSCKQYPDPLGNCYGYAALWSRRYDAFILGKNIPKSNGHENSVPYKSDEVIPLTASTNCNKNYGTRNCEPKSFTKPVTLKLNNKIAAIQDNQFNPDYIIKSSDIFLLEKGLLKLLNSLEALQKGDAVIINAFAVMGGHAMGFRKVSHNHYEFFDSNKGMYKVPNIESFKEWLPRYFNKKYHGVFYAFNCEPVTRQPVSSTVNLISVALFHAKRILTLPMAIPHIFNFVKTQLNYLGKKIINGLPFTNPRKQNYVIAKGKKYLLGTKALLYRSVFRPTPQQLLSESTNELVPASDNEHLKIKSVRGMEVMPIRETRVYSRISYR